MDELEIKEKCFFVNKTLLDNHANKLGISYEELETQIIMVATNPTLFDMAKKMLDIYRQNANAAINFGDYGAKIAKDLNLNEDLMFRALVSSASNVLVFNVVAQIHVMLNSKE